MSGVVGSDPSFAYWDCEDTTLDATDPDASRGGEATLVGGPSTTVLVRFGDLGRVLGRTRHIRKATLHFTLASGDHAGLTSVTRLLQPWGEGPYQTINATLSLLGQATADGKQGKPLVPKMAATWKSRLYGSDGGAWQQPGAKGPLDGLKVPDASVVAAEKEVQIQGLASTFQWLADHPTNNHGIALNFSTPVEFYSAQAPLGRPRLELELDGGQAGSGPDLSVISIEKLPTGGFQAHVKNVGDAPASGFESTWSFNGRVGSSVGHSEVLQPGQEIPVETSESIRGESGDHRGAIVQFDLKPTGPDANPANNGLLVFSQGRGISFVFDSKVADLAKTQTNLDGSRSAEDWIQAQLRVFNETYLAQSHFSFAPDGCKERVFASSVTESKAGGSAANSEPVVHITAEMFADGGFSRSLAKAVGAAIGLPNYDPMEVVARSGRVTVTGASDRGTEDLYSGLMGGGDTRFDGQIPGAISLAYEPSLTPDDAAPLAEPSGLLSMTDVYVLNSRLEKPVGGGIPSVAPHAVLLRARDILQRPLGGMALSFYQSVGSKIPDGPPTFKLTLNDSGLILIPNRDSGGIFGKLEPDASNGLLLVKADYHGISEWGWIKAWQVVDAFARGNVGAGIIDLSFNVPGSELEMDRDLASQKFVSDSTGQAADHLAAVVDGDGVKTISLGTKIGDWIEVDLGRDRTLADIRISAPADRFWQSFDVLLYGTGQRPQLAVYIPPDSLAHLYSVSQPFTPATVYYPHYPRLHPVRVDLHPSHPRLSSSAARLGSAPQRQGA